MGKFRSLGVMWLGGFITVLIEVFVKMITEVEGFIITNFIALFVLFCIWLIIEADKKD